MEEVHRPDLLGFSGSALLLLISITALVGCSGRTVRNFHVSCKNSGDMDITELCFSFDDFESIPMLICAGTSKTHLRLGDDFPIPEDVTLSWQSSDGKSHLDAVDLRGLFTGLDGVVTIVFSVDSENQLTTSVVPD